jgi:hypothetical protein
MFESAVKKLEIIHFNLLLNGTCHGNTGGDIENTPTAAGVISCAGMFETLDRGSGHMGSYENGAIFPWDRAGG